MVLMIHRLVQFGPEHPRVKRKRVQEVQNEASHLSKLIVEPWCTKTNGIKRTALRFVVPYQQKDT